ncbi:MAG: hypothetical protein AAF639_11895 [Chloroflexota bacterium]
MDNIRYTLITDGSSDAVLIPILNWLLVEHGNYISIQSQWADFAKLPRPPKTLIEKIDYALDKYPCDLLFIHRDAERESREDRQREIDTAYANMHKNEATPLPYICVIPVRMTEAWLLFDEGAVRRAAGNESTKIFLDVPPLYRLESLPDPKTTLHDLLRKASGLQGRRLKKFSTHQRVRHISELIDDFSPLRALSAFGAMEYDVQRLIELHSMA